MKQRLIQIWCWIIGHNIICLKRFSVLHDQHHWPWTTTSAFQCVRCDKRWQEQWDE